MSTSSVMSKWRVGPPQFHDVIVLVRRVEERPANIGPWLSPSNKGTAFCCWDSTSDCWVLHWVERSIEERYADDDPDYSMNAPIWPDDLRWTDLPEGP